jgi:hypothetical protein
MKVLFGKKALSCAKACRPVALFALAASFAVAPAAKADSFGFSFSGGGLSGSGVIVLSSTPTPGVPGAYQVVGISGTFSDSIAGISNAAITGIRTTSLPTNINADGTFIPPGQAADGSGFSYDNLFYPDGNSPAICPPDPSEAPYTFSGGVFDIYGLVFNVAGGYSVDLWSNGVLPGSTTPTYGAGDSFGGTPLNVVGEPFDGPGVALSTSPVPEPGSLILLGTGLLGIAAPLTRKFRHSA